MGREGPWGPCMGSVGPGGDGPKKLELEPKILPRHEVGEQKDAIKFDTAESRPSYGAT